MQSFYGALPALQVAAGQQRGHESWVAAAGSANVPSAPSQMPRRAKSQGVMRTARSYNSCSSFYGDGVWPQARPTAPPIFRVGGRRPDAANALDRQLRACSSMRELTTAVAASLDEVDLGNAAIALSCAAKLATEKEVRVVQAHPLWEELLKFVADGTSSFEPRGLSMVVYALAKLGGGSQTLLQRLAARGAERAEAFTVGDIAKMCWAFAKLGVFGSAAEFWSVIEVEAESKVHEGTYIDVSMIAWAFATAELGSKALYMEVSRAALASAAELCPQSLSNTAWALAKARVRDTELFEALSARAKDVATDFTETEVTMLCWAQAKADEVDYQLFEMLAVHTVSANLLPRFAAQMVSYMAWAYATAHVPHFQLFEALADHVVETSSSMSPQHISNIAWAFATLELKFPAALEALVATCRGGKLWDYKPDEFAALFWALSRLQWIDSALLIEMMQVAEQRLSQFDGASIANMISSIMLLPQADNSSLAETAATTLWRLVQTCSAPPIWPEPEALAAGIRACCREKCFELATTLWEALTSQAAHRGAQRRAVEQARASMIGAIELYGDARQAAHLWEGLAVSICHLPELAIACRNCAALVLVKRGYASEAQVILQRLADEQHFNAVSALVVDECGEAQAYMATRAVDPDSTAPDVARRHLQLARLLTIVLQELMAKPRDAISVLAAVRNSGIDVEALSMPASLQHVESEVALSQRSILLELGSWSGSSSVGLGAIAKQSGSLVLTNEDDPLVAAVSRSLCLLADVGDTVTTHIGVVEDSLQRIAAEKGCESVGALVLRGHRAQSEFERAAALGLLGRDCVVMADCLLRPSHPRLLSVLQDMLPEQLNLVEVSNLALGEDWLAFGCFHDHGAKKATLTRPVLPEFAAFVAESNKLWRRRKVAVGEAANATDDCTATFIQEFKAACALQGWIPSTNLDGRESITLQAVGRPLQATEDPSALETETGAAPSDAILLQDLSTLSFRSWLALVDKSGSLEIYSQALEMAYSNPLQVVQTFAAERSNPAEFFETFHVDLEHQAKFAEWLEVYAQQVQNGANGHALKLGLNHIEHPSSDGAKGTQPTFMQWLSQIDPGGSLAVYADSLREAFDTVAQVELAYKQPDGLLDHQFFLDIGIQDPVHRRMFDQWSAAEGHKANEGHDDMMFDYESLDRLLDAGNVQEGSVWEEPLQNMEAADSETPGRRLSRDLLQMVYTKAADCDATRPSARRLSQGVLHGIDTTAANDAELHEVVANMREGALGRRVSAPARMLSRGILSEVYARTCGGASSSTTPSSCPPEKAPERRISRTILDGLYAAQTFGAVAAVEGIDNGRSVGARVNDTDDVMKMEESSLYAVLHPFVNARAGPHLSAEQVGRLLRGQRVQGVEESGWLRLDAQGCKLANVPGHHTVAWVMLDGSQLGLGVLLEKVSEPITDNSGRKDLLFFDFDALDDMG